MTKISKIVYLFLSMVFFILLNFYISNYIIFYGYNLQENPIIDIVLIQNQGAAFNIFEGYRIFLITFALFAIIGILFYTIRQIKILSTFSIFLISLLSAGIFNNMVERLFFGYVRDFIKLNFIDFPIFNISDIFINIGVLGLVLIILKRNYIKTEK